MAKRIISIRLEVELIERLKERAAKEGIPYQKLMRRLIRDGLDGRVKEDKLDTIIKLLQTEETK